MLFFNAYFTFNFTAYEEGKLFITVEYRTYEAETSYNSKTLLKDLIKSAYLFYNDSGFSNVESHHRAMNACILKLVEIIISDLTNFTVNFKTMQLYSSEIL